MYNVKNILENVDVMSEVADNENMLMTKEIEKELTNIEMSICNKYVEFKADLDKNDKVKHYEEYRDELDKFINIVLDDVVLDKQDIGRLVGKLNSARYHCEGRISSLNKYKKEN